MKTKTQNKKENEKPKRDFLWWGWRISFRGMIGFAIGSFFAYSLSAFFFGFLNAFLIGFISSLMLSAFILLFLLFVLSLTVFSILNLIRHRNVSSSAIILIIVVSVFLFSFFLSSLTPAFSFPINNATLLLEILSVFYSIIFSIINLAKHRDRLFSIIILTGSAIASLLLLIAMIWRRYHF
jgi:hypothetical protein